MNCPRCGFTLNTLDFVCPNCGNIINNSSNITLDKKNNKVENLLSSNNSIIKTENNNTNVMKNANSSFNETQSTNNNQDKFSTTSNKINNSIESSRDRNSNIEQIKYNNIKNTNINKKWIKWLILLILTSFNCYLIPGMVAGLIAPFIFIWIFEGLAGDMSNTSYYVYVILVCIHIFLALTFLSVSYINCLKKSDTLLKKIIVIIAGILILLMIYFRLPIFKQVINQFLIQSK